jgi:hypothetical protein
MLHQEVCLLSITKEDHHLPELTTEDITNSVDHLQAERKRRKIDMDLQAAAVPTKEDFL